MQIGLPLLRLAAEHLHNLLALAVTEHRVVQVDDARLLLGYLGQRIAQDSHVVVADIGNHADLFWITDYIRAVQQTANSRFDNGILHPASGAFPKGEGDKKLEVIGDNPAWRNQRQKLA